jgi:carboxypeptidase Taq
MDERITHLRSIQAELSDLGGAAAILSWDQQTYMPPAAAEMRGQQLGTLGKLAHELETSAEYGKLLEELRPLASSLDPDSDEARLIFFAQRDFELATRLPVDFVVEQAEVTTMANQAWMEARARSDFSHFRPHLEKIVDLTHRFVGFFPPADHPYDILLDLYEPGMKTAEVQAIFAALRPVQVELIRAIRSQPQVDDTFLHQKFDEHKQWDFGVEVITAFGYDWQRGRQDRSAHPFTNGPGNRDVRITTRLAPDFLNTMLFGTMHEAGHALYDQGRPDSLERTNLARGASFGVHESQSRMWENLVGRSLPFWQHFYPRLQAIFPEQLGRVPLEKFYRGINKVQPSLIRVEADEATYNLHIMLRLEIEIGLLEGKLAVGDLPEIWNDRMKDYLGITPADDARGVMQDIHWSWGNFGYFPTYTLGNLISAQLWEKISRDLPGLPDEIRAGQFGSLLAWLRANIHVHGRKFMPQELVKRVTGRPIDPAPYLHYLQKKYGEIYGL